MNPMMTELLTQAYHQDRQRELRRAERLQFNMPAQSKHTQSKQWSRHTNWRQISHVVGGQLVRLGTMLQTFGAVESAAAPVQTCEYC